MVLLYSPLFKPFQFPSRTNEKPESAELVKQPKIPLDDKIQEHNRRDGAREPINHIQQTYHLERRLFL